jgi:GMP synthase-like glutamine amidotransferase
VKIHVFQHVPFEDIGNMRDWLASRRADLAYTRFFAGDPLPALDDIDGLIVLGGPMSVNDEADLSWLKTEKQFLREAIARQLPVLGVCLGAQLIASALGARVFPHVVKEIGWFPIQGVAGPSPALFHFPAETTVFHWHGDTFDLPPHATHLARSAACENQAFQIGRTVLALQFHLEVTPEDARQMADHGRAELVPAPYIQSASQLADIPASHYQAMTPLMHAVMSYVFEAD